MAQKGYQGDQRQGIIVQYLEVQSTDVYNPASKGQTQNAACNSRIYQLLTLAQHFE